jgi:hypothetical protein
VEVEKIKSRKWKLLLIKRESLRQEKSEKSKAFWYTWTIFLARISDEIITMDLFGNNSSPSETDVARLRVCQLWNSCANAKKENLI